jgi:type IV secretory pathway TraG/TraD family ATPase VirD4
MNPLTFIDGLMDGSLFNRGLDTPLLDWRRGEKWKVAQATEGTLIVGSTGSGKTSGSGATIARALLRNGFSGLVLTVKKDEPDNWRDLCEKEGRSHDLLCFRPGSGFCFNPLEFESINENRVQLFLKLSELGLSGGTTPATDFWIEERKKLLRNLFQLVESAGLVPSVTILAAILKGAPSTLAEVGTAAWQRDSQCAQAIRTATSRMAADMDTMIAVEYFEQEFPTLSSRTRSIVVSMVSSTFDLLRRSPLRQLFTETSNISPRSIFEGSKILVVDLPVKEFKDVGLYANIIWKFCFQREVERRVDKTPTFIWADEAQLFLNREDYLFQTTARSAGCASIYLTQNYPNLLDALGKHPTDSLVGNLKTLIFHQNDCPVTNEWASAMFAVAMREQESPSVPGKAPAVATVLTQVIPPHKFKSLKRGGGRQWWFGEGSTVEAYVLAFGLRVSSTKSRFHQDEPGKNGTVRVLP